MNTATIFLLFAFLFSSQGIIFPPSFRWLLAVQEIPSEKTPKTYSATSHWYYDSKANKFAIYNTLPSGDLEILVYRYDLKEYYSVTETQYQNHSTVVSCKTSNLTGSLFPTDVIDHLDYLGYSLVSNYPCQGWHGNATFFGYTQFYAKVIGGESVVRFYSNSRVHDVLEMESGEINPSIFQDPISLCKNQTHTRVK